ncbi:MAG: DUF3108 domain-containing protein [Gallionella sp.]
MKPGLLAFLWLMLCQTGIASADTPTTVFATYDVYKGRLQIGKIEEQFSRENGHYTVTSSTRATGWLALFNPGSIVISSTGAIAKTGLRPSLFVDERERNGDKNRRAEMDWNTHQLTLIEHSKRSTVALPDRTQDRLSAMYQFMFLALQPGNELDFPMTNGSKLDNYHYSVVKSELLSTPAGELDTLYLDNQAKSGENRTQIWLSTLNHNLPCKLIVTESDGDELTQILSKLEVKP